MVGLMKGWVSAKAVGAVDEAVGSASEAVSLLADKTKAAVAKHLQNVLEFGDASVASHQEWWVTPNAVGKSVVSSASPELRELKLGSAEAKSVAVEVLLELGYRVNKFDKKAEPPKATTTIRLLRFK